MIHRIAIAATPGFELVEPISGEDDKPVDLSMQPIVGWLVEWKAEAEDMNWNSALPVCIDMLPDDYAIKTPNNDVIFIADCTIPHLGGSIDKAGVIKRFVESWESLQRLKELKAARKK